MFLVRTQLLLGLLCIAAALAPSHKETKFPVGSWASSVCLAVTLAFGPLDDGHAEGVTIPRDGIVEGNTAVLVQTTSEDCTTRPVQGNIDTMRRFRNDYSPVVKVDTPLNVQDFMRRATVLGEAVYNDARTDPTVKQCLFIPKSSNFESSSLAISEGVIKGRVKDEFVVEPTNAFTRGLELKNRNVFGGLALTVALALGASYAYFSSNIAEEKASVIQKSEEEVAKEEVEARIREAEERNKAELEAMMEAERELRAKIEEEKRAKAAKVKAELDAMEEEAVKAARAAIEAAKKRSRVVAGGDDKSKDSGGEEEIEGDTIIVEEPKVKRKWARILRSFFKRGEKVSSK